MASSLHPTVMVIFGATGDVVAKKVLPALFRLFVLGHLPAYFRVIGFSRRDIPTAEFQRYVQETVKKNAKSQESEEVLANFCQLFSYTQGAFDQPEGYQALATVLAQKDEEAKTRTNHLFYLAVPPDLYAAIFPQLKAAQLNEDLGEANGWTRILIEKPFGSDEASATTLNNLLGDMFREEQIYRIEHYLEKELVRNLLIFRFGNDLFESQWNREHIERVHIRLWEEIGVETRGNFYDGVGALRDVGQNHLLQMLAMTTMERPQNFEAHSLRDARAQVLEVLQPVTPEQTFRAQYEGYRAITGVKADSQTETYFALTTLLHNERWEGVPFLLEAGKALGRARKEIEVVFRHQEPCLCPIHGEHRQTRLVISLDPKEGISLTIQTTIPGKDLETESRNLALAFTDHEWQEKAVEGYEKVVLDALIGDQSRFISRAELTAMWRFVDPIQAAWQQNSVPLRSYESGAEAITGEAEADLLTRKT